MTRIVGAFIAAGLVLLTAGCGRGSSGGTPTFPPKVAQDEVTFPLVNLVARVLGEADQPGSLIYEGNCSPGKPNDPFELRPPAPGVPPLQALHEAFSHDPQLTAKLQSGLIRVAEVGVPHDLLDLRISQISFRNEDDPRDAVGRLLALPVVRDYMRNHHIYFLVVLPGISALPSKGGPRLNGTIKGAAVFQVLDRIVRTFPGMWIYRECAGSRGERFVYIGFQQFSPQTSSGSPRAPAHGRRARPERGQGD